MEVTRYYPEFPECRKIKHMRMDLGYEAIPLLYFIGVSISKSLTSGLNDRIVPCIDKVHSHI